MNYYLLVGCLHFEGWAPFLGEKIPISLTAKGIRSENLRCSHHECKGKSRKNVLHDLIDRCYGELCVVVMVSFLLGIVKEGIMIACRNICIRFFCRFAFDLYTHTNARSEDLFDSPPKILGVRAINLHLGYFDSTCHRQVANIIGARGA